MKYITVKFTEDQANYIFEQLPANFAIHNPTELAFVKRIQDKLAKAKTV